MFMRRRILTDAQRKASKKRSQRKWYLKRQAYRHKHHLKSSKSHLQSNKRWMRRNRGRQMLYQKRSYCKHSILHASKNELHDWQYLVDVAKEKLES